MALQIITTCDHPIVDAGVDLGEWQDRIPLYGEKRKRKLVLNKKEVMEEGAGGSNGEATHGKPVEGLCRWKDLLGDRLWLWEVLELNYSGLTAILQHTISSTPAPSHHSIFEVCRAHMNTASTSPDSRWRIHFFHLGD